MPAQHRIDRKQNIAFSILEGTLSNTELLQHQHAVQSDPAFNPTLDHVIDMRNARMEAITAITVNDLAHATRFSKDSRRAMLISSDEQYGLSRMFQMLLDPPQDVRIFTDLESALTWLKTPR
jgi:hypothetical protein